MGRMEAQRRKARPVRLRHSQSFASRRQRFSQAIVLSTIQRFGRFCQRSRQGGRGRDALRASALRGLQNGEHGRGTTEVKEASAVGGNVLAMAGADTEMVA